MSKMTCPKEYLSFFKRVMESKPEKHFTNIPMPVECRKEIEELAEKEAFIVEAADALPNAAVVWRDTRYIVLYRATADWLAVMN